MKLFAKCTNCTAEIDFRSNAHTRVEFAMNEGEEKKLQCSICGAASLISVDKMYAKSSKIAQLVAGSAFIVGTLISIYVAVWGISASRNHYAVLVFGGFLLIPVFAYITLTKQDERRVSDFNRTKLKK